MKSKSLYTARKVDYTNVRRKEDVPPMGVRHRAEVHTHPTKTLRIFPLSHLLIPATDSLFGKIFSFI